MARRACPPLSEPHRTRVPRLSTLGRAALAAFGALAIPAVLLAAPSREAARSRPAPGAGRALAVRIEGPVSPVMAEIVTRAIRRAEAEGYRALVFEIDTPGGLESSMRTIVQRMLASEVPILTWVTPSGSRAASAGVFIVMAGNVAAMAPGTNIGAATPVNLQGPMDSTLARKATSDAAAFARTVAAQRGRSISWAEQAVRQAVAASETEAVELDVVDFVAGSMEELLAKADGRLWKGAPLHLKGLEVDRVDVGFRQRVLALLADPNVAYILLMIGFYGVLFELQNPGAILPGVVGGICLILAFFALSTLSVNYAGIALILLAVVFFIAEIKVASHGLLAAGGVIAMLLGSLFLFHGETARLSLGLIVGATLATALFFLFIVAAGLRAQGRPVRTGSRGLRGTRGTTVERLDPAGRIRLGDELWNARSESPIEVGEMVEIMEVEGLTLRVRPVAKEAGR